MLDIKRFVEGLHDYIGKAFAPVIKRLTELEQKQVSLTEVKIVVEEAIDELPPTKDGTSVTLEEVLEKIPIPKDGKDGINGKDGASVTVEEVVAAMPKPKDGENGKDGINGKDGASVTVEEVVAAMPKPKDGENGKDGINGKDGASVTVEEVVAAMPKPKDGENGENGKDGINGKDGKDGIDGKSVTVEEVVALIPKPKDGVDGKSVTPEQVTEIVNTLLAEKQAQWELSFERRAIAHLQGIIERMPKPKDGVDGKDGFDLEDYDEEFDGERVITRRFRRGDVVKEFKHRMPWLIERGVYVRDTEYEKGDCVTYGGNYWTVIVEKTMQKPGDDNQDWRLIVRKGRDGKDGGKGPKGDPGRPAPNGTGVRP